MWGGCFSWRLCFDVLPCLVGFYLSYEFVVVFVFSTFFFIPKNELKDDSIGPLSDESERDFFDDELHDMLQASNVDIKDC